MVLDLDWIWYLLTECMVFANGILLMVFGMG